MSKFYKRIKVSQIELDIKNPRLGVDLSSIKGSRNKLIENLIEKDKIKELADSIASNGYVSDRLPIVYPNGSKYVVLEGNRRVLALQLLQNPSIAPTNQRNKFIDIRKKAIERGNIESEIDVYVYKSKDLAIRLISQIHTSNEVKKWDRFSQGKFYYEQLIYAGSKETFLEKFGLGPLDAKKMIFLYKLIDYIQNKSGLSGKLKGLFERGSKGSRFVSTIEKLFFDFREKFNIDLSDDFKDLEIKNKNDFKKKLKKIIPHLEQRGDKKEKLTTRSFDSYKDKVAVKKYIQSPSKANLQAVNTTGVSRGKYLSDSYPICEPKNKKLQKLFKTLNTLSGPTKSNIVWYSIVYFVFVEIVIHTFLKKEGKIGPYIEDKIRRKYKEDSGGKNIGPNELRKREKEEVITLSEMIKILKDQNLIPRSRGRDAFYSISNKMNKDYNLGKHDLNVLSKPEDVEDYIAKSAQALDYMIERINTR